MELPAYRTPQFRGLMTHLWDKAKHFIQKAFTIILASTIIVWLVSHFSWGWSYLPDENINQSILASLGRFIQPLLTPMGFGSQLNEHGWVFVVAAATGLIAKENVIATFGTLAATLSAGFVGGDEGLSAVVQMITSTGISVPALLAFIAFNMTTIPCFAAVATAKAELVNKKKFKSTIIFWLVTSYVVSSMVYIIGSWWWTSFVFLALAVFVVVAIVYINKHNIQLRGLQRKKKNSASKKSILGCGYSCSSCTHCSTRDTNTTSQAPHHRRRRRQKGIETLASDSHTQVEPLQCAQPPDEPTTDENQEAKKPHTKD